MLGRKQLWTGISGGGRSLDGDLVLQKNYNIKRRNRKKKNNENNKAKNSSKKNQRTRTGQKAQT
jgi:hypothetical protein